MRYKPKKSLGQNFLINKDIIKEIVKIGELKNNIPVIEIGPGTGNLTEEILKSNPRNLYAIEKDKLLFNDLKNKFKNNIKLINKDVLKIDWQMFCDNQYIVFGNLPYNISSKLLINWLRLNNLNLIFKKLILMFQKEVADRIVADVNSSKYGRLSILTSWKMDAKKIMDIDADNFYPKPKVRSSLVYFEPKQNYYKFNNSICLEKVTDIFFQNKRKMIKKPLKLLFNNSKQIVEKFNLDENCRPQNIKPFTFFELSKEYENQNY
tara:strand:+ start:2007 stop:2798 length:792 start_codon:yes stop_codon:yes gene_type:complete